MNKKNSHVPIEGSELPIILNSDKVGPAKSSDIIEVDLYLRVKESSPGLPSLENMINTSLSQREHLSENEFEKLYGADTDDMLQVIEVALEYGLSVVYANLIQGSIRLSGAVKDVNDAFNIDLYVFKDKTLHFSFMGYEGPVSIPKKLGGIVVGVFGLCNYASCQPNIRGPIIHFAPRWLTDLKEVEFNLSPFFTPSQVAEAYNFPKPPDATGKGQTIGLIELGGGYLCDTLKEYFYTLNLIENRNRENLLKVPTIVDVNCGADNSPGDNWQYDMEVCANIEVAGAIANDATLVMYFGKEELDDSGFLRALTTAVCDFENNPTIISISWGSKEENHSEMFKSVMNRLFQLAASRNITVCVATGDTGSSDCCNPLFPPDDDKAHVDFPSSSPWVLACGGTWLQIEESKKEVVWNDGKIIGATGGGVSNFFACPAYQSQSGISPRHVDSNRVGRGIPDVAGNCSWQSGYFLKSNNGPFSFGAGTSLVAPLWGALIALLNEKLSKELKVPIQLGFINDRLYQIKEYKGTFNDITKGDNANIPPVQGYEAGKGWDACTGLGTPNGDKIYEALREILKKT
ncbi:MAG: hypothetical protein JSV88_22520 [Candidatus Aminicenantes bacterium]|nr:MAG: hypothetical protein JSV88_22520 [Candidatus Aminicenantes bacterium]